MPAGEVRVAATPHLDGVYWLPPTSVGNGLTATAWAPLADLPVLMAREFMTASRSAHVAAAMAPCSDCRHRRPVEVYRVWVDSLHVSLAEDVLRAVISECRGRHEAGAR